MGGEICTHSIAYEMGDMEYMNWYTLRVGGPGVDDGQRGGVIKMALFIPPLSHSFGSSSFVGFMCWKRRECGDR